MSGIQRPAGVCGARTAAAHRACPWTPGQEAPGFLRRRPRMCRGLWSCWLSGGETWQPQHGPASHTQMGAHLRCLFVGLLKGGRAMEPARNV